MKYSKFKSIEEEKESQKTYWLFEGKDKELNKELTDEEKGEVLQFVDIIREETKELQSAYRGNNADILRNYRNILNYIDGRLKNKPNIKIKNLNDLLLLVMEIMSKR